MEYLGLLTARDPFPTHICLEAKVFSHPAGVDNSNAKAEQNFFSTKDYKCSVGVEFPQTEEEGHLILTNITDVVKSMTTSAVDLDYLKAKVLNEHEEEIMFMDFANLATMDLKTLPWSAIKFEALNLSRGSTVLAFRIKFKEPPKNSEDANVYRLMELFILSAVENIPGWQMLRERRSPKGQGLLRKEGPPKYAILSRNFKFRDK